MLLQQPPRLYTSHQIFNNTIIDWSDFRLKDSYATTQSCQLNAWCEIVTQITLVSHWMNLIPQAKIPGNPCLLWMSSLHERKWVQERKRVRERKENKRKWNSLWLEWPTKPGSFALWFIYCVVWPARSFLSLVCSFPANESRKESRLGSFPPLCWEAKIGGEAVIQ